MTIKSDLWPFEATSREKGVTVFAPAQLTIKKLIVGGPQSKSPGKFFGWSFVEDTTDAGEYQGKPQRGAIWGPPQAWDEVAQEYLPYAGPKFAAGQKVDVILSLTEKGESIYRKVYDIVPVSQGEGSGRPPQGTDEPTEDAGAPPHKEQPAPHRDIVGESIEKQVAYKDAAPVLAALIAHPEQTVFTPYEVGALKEWWWLIGEELAGVFASRIEPKPPAQEGQD
jgi:hypothetical protein